MFDSHAVAEPADSSDRIEHRMARILEDATLHRRMILVVDTPLLLSRMSLYQALGEQIGRWGRRAGDLTAFIDMSNHPALPAQTVICGVVQNWDDLADGLPEALCSANILVVIGLERMLQETPHRLAAFLEARARHQVVVVLTPLPQRVCALQVRDTPLHLDQSIANESDLEVGARAVTRAAIAAARLTTRRDPVLSSTDPVDQERP